MPRDNIEPLVLKVRDSVRSRGKPRKAMVPPTPIPEMSTGAPHSDGGGHAVFDTQGREASPTTRSADPDPVGGGEDRARGNVTSQEDVPGLATPTPEPAVRRGRSRKAIGIVTSCTALPSGATLSNQEPPDLKRTIEKLADLQRQRQFCIASLVRQGNATLALIRTLMGWTLERTDKERKAIEKRAKALIQMAEKGRVPDDPREAEVLRKYSNVILAAHAAEAPFNKAKLTVEKEMAAHARALPACLWMEGVRGFGVIGLASIIGEAGDLSKYSNPAKLWKRMGLGLVGDKLQGKPGHYATTEDWHEHGYSPKRRSLMWNIGDSLIKGNKDGEEPGHYRQLYLDRKVREREKAAEEGLLVAEAEKIPAGQAHLYRSKMQIHRRAQRYMEKRLLKDLWRVWRRIDGNSANDGQPLSQPHELDKETLPG